ncbi:unnamed protein product [Schistosoma spindalis]|nr:unnamed protein product [Schistosoma spindale]
MSDPGHSIDVIFGGQKYLVPLPLTSDATLLDLMKSIDSILHIPFDKQRIIYKGRSLTDPDALISSSGLTPGSRVMILGSVDKLNPDEAVKLVKAKDTSDAVDLQLKDLSNKLDTIVSSTKKIYKSRLFDPEWFIKALCSPPKFIF